MKKSIPEYPCPACGFLTFEEPSGSYDICPLCGWEDDPVQLAFPRLRIGANGYSLLEAQQDALQDYPLALQQTGAYRRDAQWRPLTEADVGQDTDAPTDGFSYFEAAGVVSPTYYWLTDTSGDER